MTRLTTIDIHADCKVDMQWFPGLCPCWIQLVVSHLVAYVFDLIAHQNPEMMGVFKPTSVTGLNAQSSS